MTSLPVGKHTYMARRASEVTSRHLGDTCVTSLPTRVLPAITTHVNKTEIEFTINTDGKVTITLRDGYRVRLRREQAIVLGFMNFEDSAETYYVKYTKTGSYKANLHRETNILVYCNIVQPQIVGDKLIPLVATVPYQKTSESYDETFYAVENIHYIPVQTKAFQNVKVHLRSSTEEPIPFEHGRATITLHLKLLNYFD